MDVVLAAHAAAAAQAAERFRRLAEKYFHPASRDDDKAVALTAAAERSAHHHSEMLEALGLTPRDIAAPTPRALDDDICGTAVLDNEMTIEGLLPPQGPRLRDMVDADVIPDQKSATRDRISTKREPAEVLAEPAMDLSVPGETRPGHRPKPPAKRARKTLKTRRPKWAFL